MKKIVYILVVLLLVSEKSNANSSGVKAIIPSCVTEKPFVLVDLSQFQNNYSSINYQYRRQYFSELYNKYLNKHSSDFFNEDHKCIECNSNLVISYLSDNREYLHEDIETRDIMKLNTVLGKLNRIICAEYSVREVKKQKAFDNIKALYIDDLDLKLKILENVKTEKDFFPIDVNDIQGFGIRLKI